MMHSCKDKSNMVQLPEGVTPFVHINQNVFLRRKHKKLKEDDIAIFECKYDANDPESACVERCLNVLTNTECTLGYCQCGETCRSQILLAVHIYSRKLNIQKLSCTGLTGVVGVFLADENIKAGQFIEYCGEVISSEAAKKRSHAYEAHDLKDTYIISLDANCFIDSTRKGNFSRFINHSRWNQVIGHVRIIILDLVQQRRRSLSAFPRGRSLGAFPSGRSNHPAVSKSSKEAREEVTKG